jgi:hypothetical protein
MAPNRTIAKPTPSIVSRRTKRNWNRQPRLRIRVPNASTSYQDPFPSDHQTLDGVYLHDARPHLWLTKDNLELRIGELLKTIHGRRSLSEIAIYNILSRFSNQDLVCLYDTIAQLPRLQSFSVWSSQCLAVPIITSVLGKAQGLLVMTLSNLRINRPEHVEQLAAAIRDHPALTRLSLDNIRISTIMTTATTCTVLSLDPLLEAIAHNPRVESLRISVSDDDDDDDDDECYDCVTIAVAPASLTALCRHPRLKELSLWNVPVCNEGAQAMASILSQSPFSRALQTMSLRHCGPKLTKNGHQALVHMLQSNYRLESLHVDTAEDASLKWQIEIVCYLNKSGTREMLKNHPAKESVWLEALARHSEELNTLFYLLRDCGGATMLIRSPSQS